MAGLQLSPRQEEQKVTRQEPKEDRMGERGSQGGVSLSVRGVKVPGGTRIFFPPFLHFFGAGWLWSPWVLEGREELFRGYLTVCRSLAGACGREYLPPSGLRGIEHSPGAGGGVELTFSREICRVIWSVIGFLLVSSRILPRGALSCRQHTVSSGSMPMEGPGR